LKDISELERLELQRHLEMLYPKLVLDKAISNMAIEVTRQIELLNPTVICVLAGGLFVTASLVQALNFPLKLGFTQVSRYRGETVGQDIKTVVDISIEGSMEGEHILLVDDIFDEGVTLEHLVIQCLSMKAASVRTAVLIKKVHDRKTTSLQPDFIGLTAPDKFLIGCGMDYKGYFRNLPDIYTIS